MRILGLNMAHADASAAMVVDGKLTFAIAEERLNRKKHYGGFPQLAIQACLASAGISIEDVDYVAIGRDSSANLMAKVGYAIRNPAKVLNALSIRKKRLHLDDLKTLLSVGLDVDPQKLNFKEVHVEHHLAHVASTFYTADVDDCAAFTYDGSGDFASAMFARCEGREIEIVRRIMLPESLGSFYSAVCRFIGYRKYGDEGKVMGLAPYGRDNHGELMQRMIAVNNGVYSLNAKYVKPVGSDQGFHVDEDGRVHQTLSFQDQMVDELGPPREPNAELTERDKDLAFGVQKRFEEVTLEMLRHFHGEVSTEHLAMAGGCALNSVVNGKIVQQTPFTKTYIHPAAGDEGLAVGAALYAWHAVLGNPREHLVDTAYLGNEYDDGEIRKALRARGLKWHDVSGDELVQKTAQAIFEGKIIGWFQGRMEWGPRALGARSILAHPGKPDMKDVLNARIKHREWYRPFAPSILEEYQSEWFAHGHPSPYMLHVFVIKPEYRERLCAVNHVDNTGRLQSVSKQQSPLYHKLISEFHKLSGIPVVLNTSFNENEPIVCSPDDAVDCFIRSRMDVLSIGNHVIYREEQTGMSEFEQI